MKSESKKTTADKPEAEPVAAPTPIIEPDPQQRELAEQKDAFVHLAADFENFKRRSRQESDARATAQKEGFIVELLPVIDNLERALISGAAPGAPEFRQGVEMTLQQLRRLLQQHGVECDEITGWPFDPRQHEALSQRHDPAQAHQTILEVFQRGYRRGTKVIRPAKVVVNDLASANPEQHAR